MNLLYLRSFLLILTVILHVDAIWVSNLRVSSKCMYLVRYKLEINVLWESLICTSRYNTRVLGRERERKWGYEAYIYACLTRIIEKLQVTWKYMTMSLLLRSESSLQHTWIGIDIRTDTLLLYQLYEIWFVTDEHHFITVSSVIFS